MIKRRKLISIITNILLILIFFILYCLDVMNIESIIILGTMVNIYILFDFYCNFKTFKSGYFIFCFLSLPFLYGQTFTKYILNFTPKNTFNLEVLVTRDGMVKAIFLIVFCQLFMNLGYIIYKDVTCSKKRLINVNLDIDKKKCLFIGWLLFILTIIPALIQYYNDLNLSILYGYSGKLLYVSYGYSSILSKLIPFFYISVLLLIIGYKDNKVLSSIIFWCSIVFYGSQIIFGNRGIPLLSVICIMFLYNFYVKKFNFRKLIFIVCIIFILIPFLNTLKNNRKVGLSQWINNTGTVIKENYIDNNPLLELCYEMGTTIYPISYTVTAIPERINYKYGSNYFYSLLSVVRLNTSSSSNDDFTLKMNIAQEIGNVAGASFGGSYIQEAYANFGWFCVIFMFIFGIIFKKMDISLYNANLYIHIVLIVYILSSILWIIRNTMVSIPRDIFWYLVPVYVLYYIFGNRVLIKKSSKWSV